MKFLSTVALLVVSASATGLKPRQREARPIYSSYELSLVAPDAPYDGGAVTLKDGKLGFYGSSEAEPLSIGVYDYYDEEGPAGQVVRAESAEEADPFVALAGQAGDGLRELVTTEVELEADGAFAFSHNAEDGEDFLFDVQWRPEGAAAAEGGEPQAWGGEGSLDGGRWIVASVGEDEWELHWYDGASFTTANVFPVRLVGRLTAQS